MVGFARCLMARVSHGSISFDCSSSVLHCPVCPLGGADCERLGRMRHVADSPQAPHQDQADHGLSSVQSALTHAEAAAGGLGLSGYREFAHTVAAACTAEGCSNSCSCDGTQAVRAFLRASWAALQLSGAIARTGFGHRHQSEGRGVRLSLCASDWQIVMALTVLASAMQGEAPGTLKCCSRDCKQKFIVQDTGMPTALSRHVPCSMGEVVQHLWCSAFPWRSREMTCRAVLAP